MNEYCEFGHSDIDECDVCEGCRECGSCFCDENEFVDDDFYDEDEDVMITESGYA